MMEIVGKLGRVRWEVNENLAPDPLETALAPVKTVPEHENSIV